MTPCIEFPKTNTQGYGRIRRRKDGRQYEGRAHRVIYQMTYGVLPPGIQVRHKCDNRACIRLDHLEPGTNQDNINDMVERERFSLHNRKLTDEQVRDIYASTESGVELASRYGVDQSTITKVRKGRRWSHLTKAGK